MTSKEAPAELAEAQRMLAKVAAELAEVAAEITPVSVGSEDWVLEGPGYRGEL